MAQNGKPPDPIEWASSLDRRGGLRLKLEEESSEVRDWVLEVLKLRAEGKAPNASYQAICQALKAHFNVSITYSSIIKWGERYHPKLTAEIRRRYGRA